MRRLVVLTFSFLSLWTDRYMAIFSYRPFGTPCILTLFSLTLPPSETPLHWLGVSSYPPHHPILRKSTCILVDVSVVVCFCLD